MLLTRSPLGHPPEGGASLDLHVLSTPPAFVLSQDQTLRECFVWLPEPSTTVTVCLRSDRWSRQAVCSSYTKGIRHGCEDRSKTATHPRTGLLALTFGTLLSSQGAGAHLRQPLGRLGGNSQNVTWSVSRCQTRRSDLTPPTLPGADAMEPCVLAEGPDPGRGEALASELGARPVRRDLSRPRSRRCIR